MKELKPIKLIPTFKDYIWGGNKLVYEYNKKCDMERVAESWKYQLTKTVKVLWQMVSLKA